MKMKNGFVAMALFYLLIVVAIASAPLIMQGISFYTICEPEKAFYLSEAGVRHYIKAHLDGDTNWTDNTTAVTKTFSGGQFTVTPSNQQESIITLQSTGSVISEGSDTFDRVVEYTLRRPGAAAFSGDSLFYGGGGGGDGTGDLTLDFVNEANLGGDIYIGGDYDSQHNSNLNTGEVIDNQSTADVPEPDWAYWQTEADTVISGDYLFADGTYNGVYYIDGNVELDGSNIIFNGTIIATGDIIFDHTNTLQFNPDAQQPAVVAGNDICVTQGNDMVFNGPIYAYDDIMMDHVNNIEIYGPIVFGDEADIEHANNITVEMWGHSIVGGFTGGDQVSDNQSIGGYEIIEFKEI
jgi:hypothetical protein